jgi:hypothetical protein
MIVSGVKFRPSKGAGAFSTINSNEVRIEKGFAEVYVNGALWHKFDLSEWKIVIQR